MTESNLSSNPDPAAGTGTESTPAEPQQEVLGGPQGDTTRKDPEEWVTGDEPMTGAQRSYLDTLAREAGEQLPADLTKAEASEHIDRLQSASDRTS
jgi:hypothetical protein